MLRRDLPRIRAILQQRPHLLEKERNIFGQTPLFLAVGWPDGLEVLLQAANDSVLHDCCSLGTPLDYAIARGCAESMKLLATADLAFNFRWSELVATAALDPAISDLLLRLIMERCRQLHNFGLMVLPEELIKSLQLDDFEIFISKAWLMFNYLGRGNITIPAKFKIAGYSDQRGCFCPCAGSILHLEDLSLTGAQTFLNEGFNRIDIDCEGLTPLMCLQPKLFNPKRFLELVNFFVEKGARLDKEIPPRYIAGFDLTKSGTHNHHRAIHRVASMSWCYLRYLELEIPHILEGLKLGSSPVWKSLITSIDSDPCLCACSSDGCRSISLALKMSVGRFERPFSDLRNWERTLKLLRVLATLLESLMGQYLVRDVVRFLTFSALELTHTCCNHNNYFSTALLSLLGVVMIWLKDPTEIEEIREEKASMIDRLDLLVEEFMKDIDELAISLPEFLRTRWPERMYAELSKKDEMSEIEQRAIVDLGVQILEDDEDQTEEMPNVPVVDRDERIRREINDYDEWIRSLEESIK